MGASEFKTPRGTRDFLPEQMIVRNQVIKTISNIYETYGFSPLETPAFEYYDVLAQKAGQDTLEQIYDFKDKSDRRLALRFDLTVPLARLMGSNPTITLPFKRYCISRVWRYERQQKGRYREFWQADVDIIGSDKIAADAEVVAIAHDCLKALGFDSFQIRLNNRKLLEAFITSIGISEGLVGEAFRAMDKLDKIGDDGVKQELGERGISGFTADKILEFLEISGDPESVLSQVSQLLDSELATEALDELKELVNKINILGITENIVVDLSLVRGLSYYTGSVFEAVIPEGGVGSVAGGGRYDELIGLYSGKNIPAVGIALGLERIITVMEERNMVAKKKTVTQALVVPVFRELADETLRVAQVLRKAGVKTEVDFRGRKLRKNFDYADRLGIPFVIVVGPDELEQNKVSLRNMDSGEQLLVNIDLVGNVVKEKCTTQ